MSRKFSGDRFSRRQPSNVTLNEILCPTAFISAFASNLVNPSVSPEPCSRQHDARRFVARDEKFACYARKFFRSDAASTKALCGKLHACKFIRFIRRYSATFIDALSDAILWFPSYIPRIAAAHRTYALDYKSTSWDRRLIWISVLYPMENATDYRSARTS
jgi:hypothetical protein